MSPCKAGSLNGNGEMRANLSHTDSGYRQTGGGEREGREGEEREEKEEGKRGKRGGEEMKEGLGRESEREGEMKERVGREGGRMGRQRARDVKGRGKKER